VPRARRRAGYLPRRLAPPIPNSRPPMPLRVGILGATGAVGQKFVELLADHPLFEVTALAASERSAGRRYRDAAPWIGADEPPEALAEMEVQACEPGLDCELV